MKIIFCLFADAGHVNPYIGPAQALQELGCEVLVSSVGDIDERIKKSGLTFSSALIDPNAENFPRGKSLVEFYADGSSQIAFLKKLFLLDMRERVHRVKTWLAAEKPDGLVIDPMNDAAIIAAQVLGIPWVSMSSSLTSVLPLAEPRTMIREIAESFIPSRQENFRNFDLSATFHAADCLSPYLNITFATEAFVGSPPTNVRLVGPSLPLFARGDETPPRSLPVDMKIVYISFGSQVFYQPEIFRKIQRACSHLPLRLVFSIGDLELEPGWEDSDKVQFYRYAPQIEILKKADLFITHGGANSVMESLRANVPILVSPICNDQVHQAYFVCRSGVGRAIDLKTASESEIEQTISEILVDQEIAMATKRVSETYQVDGARKAADLCREMFQTFSYVSGQTRPLECRV